MQFNFVIFSVDFGRHRARNKQTKNPKDCKAKSQRKKEDLSSHRSFQVVTGGFMGFQEVYGAARRVHESAHEAEDSVEKLGRSIAVVGDAVGGGERWPGRRSGGACAGLCQEFVENSFEMTVRMIRDAGQASRPSVWHPSSAQ